VKRYRRCAQRCCSH